MGPNSYRSSISIHLAVDLLANGMSLEDVATLLGNTIKIAEKHYAPWVKSRQISLDKSIEKAWRLE
jgi:hypothetical protein